jgi:hypothetical protein
MQNVREILQTPSFSQNFFLYLKEHDRIYPIDLLKIIQDLEKAFEAGLAETMCKALHGEQRFREAAKKFGRENHIEFFEIWLRTSIARDKLMFYNLGLLHTKGGDLRKAQIIVDEREQLFALLKLELARKHPGVIQMVQREASKLDASFFSKMADILKQPPKKFEHIDAAELQRFLIKLWANETPTKNGKTIPPLCYFSDPAISELAIQYKIDSNATPQRVRKTWERLGLKKSRKPQFWTVCKSGTKILISEFRRSLK